jgi:L-fucose mutarotase/ribose pyranase (RbsD/FucU family)
MNLKFPAARTPLTAVALLFLLTACQAPPTARTTVPWQQKLAQELPVLGHRNWIVIADSAYPAQTGAGIETLYTGAGQLEALKAVFAALDGAKHVQPVVHLDAELAQVPEALAPGVTAYRRELHQLLQNRRVTNLPHEKLIERLDQAGKLFRVLILKTDLAIPYTSVFLELDCGYWGPEQEKKLREALGNRR